MSFLTDSYAGLGIAYLKASDGTYTDVMFTEIGNGISSSQTFDKVMGFIFYKNRS